LQVFARDDNLVVMKTPLLLSFAVLTSLVPTLSAADLAPVMTPDQVQTFHSHTLLQSITNVLLFAGIGIAAAIIGFKIFDKCTPGHLQQEIIEHKNVAAAIVAAAVILGVSIIIAASILG
jgi:hypothetical protein